MSRLISQNFLKKFKPKLSEMVSKILMVNKHIYQNFIRLTFGYNFLIKFCKDDLLIIKIIFIKFRKKIQPFKF